jgi:hypothetical protein
MLAAQQARKFVLWMAAQSTLSISLSIPRKAFARQAAPILRLALFRIEGSRKVAVARSVLPKVRKEDSRILPEALSPRSYYRVRVNE